jgi:glycerol-3-phosphate dehydrogenase
MNRETNIKRLQEETFDLCVIGGGASGAGCALDAALRGLKVALVEKADFSAGTSSRSTKLIHGGVRYLEQAFKNLDFAQLRQVRHGLKERHIVLRNAPHLARPLSIVTPVFSLWESLYYGIGLWLYDLFAAGKDTLPKSGRLSRTKLLRRLPGLNDRLYGAVRYFDGQLDDARYCLALVQSAAEAGAVVANYAGVRAFECDAAGKIDSALIEDATGDDSGHSFVPFRLRARCFLNCTGPFADAVRHMANPDLEPRIRPSKGVHAVLPRDVLAGDDALLIPKTSDGRVVFAIPFENELLLGTTDTPYPDAEEEPLLEGAEVDFLLETLRPFLKQAVDPKQVKAGFGGLRPLILPATGPEATQRSTKTLLRDHEVERDARSGLISLLGGKWTTYRLMARDAVDAACRELQFQAECTTEKHILFGGNKWDSFFWKKIQEKYGFDSDISQHLAQHYGSKAHGPATLAATPELAERVLPHLPCIKAEVVYAVREEMARTPRDFLARRIRLEITDWTTTADATRTVAEIMGRELHWSAERTTRETEAYLTLLATFRSKADTNHPEP